MVGIDENTGLYEAAAEFVRKLGLDLEDENFADTPRRIVQLYRELLHGLYSEADSRVEEILGATFKSNYDGIVVARQVEAIGVCPHHLLPVYYTVHAGYIPSGRVVGLSKIPRLIKLLAARPVMQEDFTQEITDGLCRGIPGSQGAVAIVRGHHSCVAIRGVRAENSKNITSSVRGIFASDSSAKDEFLSLINNWSGDQP